MNSTDYTELRTAAAREVDTELAKVTDPHERRARAEEIRDQANQEMADLKPERDELVAAAALADGRVTKELADAMGTAFSYAQTIAHTHNSAHLPGGRRWTGSALEEARARNPLHAEPGIHERAIKVARRYEALRARRSAAVAHLGAAHEAVLTAGGRIRAEAPKPVDFDDIRDKAEQEIRAEFAALKVTPEQRLARAAEAVDQAEDEMALLKDERDQAVASLAFYTTARAINYGAGLSREGVKRILERALGLPRFAKLPPRAEQPAAARAAGVPFVEDAAEQLPKIAAVYEAAAARRHAAIAIRTEAMRALAAHPYNPDGWSLTRLAEAIGRDVAAVHRALNPPA